MENFILNLKHFNKTMYIIKIKIEKTLLLLFIKNAEYSKTKLICYIGTLW